MDLFESTFGIIRSLINTCDYYELVEQLTMHVDQLFEEDPQRCKDVVCPYIEQTLRHRHFTKHASFTRMLELMTWEHLTPCLFEYEFNWPEDAVIVDQWYEEGVDVLYSMILTNNNPATLSSLVGQKWRSQIRSLIFDEAMTREQVDVLDMALLLPELRSLWVRAEVALDALQWLVQLPCTQNIEVVHIMIDSGSAWSTAHVDCLNQLTRLQDLHIISSGMSSFTPSESHPNLINFEHLNFVGIEYTEAWFNQPMPRLRTLSCQHSDINPQQLKKMLHTLQPKQLIALDLCRNALTAESMSHLAPVLSANLQFLWISLNMLDVACIKSFIDHGLLKTITTLNVSSCRLGRDASTLLFTHLEGDYDLIGSSSNDVDEQALVQLGHNKKLRTLTNLRLTSNPLGEGALAPLYEATWLHSLAQIHLQDCALDSVDVAQFMLAPSLSRCTYMSLGSNQLDNRWIEILTQGLPSWQNLSLDLTNNEIDTDGLLALCLWPGIAHIESLDIRQNYLDITMEMLKRFADSPHLRDIKIRFDPIDDSLNAEIEKAQLFSPSVRLFFY